MDANKPNNPAAPTAKLVASTTNTAQVIESAQAQIEGVIHESVNRIVDEAIAKLEALKAQAKGGVK